MRAETVQYEDPRLRVIQWARWGGVGLLFYTTALALDNFDVYTGQDGGFWVLLWVMVPYVAIASVLIFSHERLERSASLAPPLVAGAVAVASLALALRVLVLDEPLFGPIFAPGAWSAVRILVTVGLPMAVLLFLLTSSREGIGRVMPLVAIGAGMAVVAGSWALSVRDLSDVTSPGTWRVVQGVVPSNALGFLLIVAGAYAWDSTKARWLALFLAAVLAFDAAAMTLYWTTSVFALDEWLVATNLSIRASYIILILAFGGLLNRSVGFASASVCLLAAIIAAVGMAAELEPETSNWLWAASFGVVSVMSSLVLALVTVEVQRGARDESEPVWTNEPGVV